ncbi:MAG: hypothetical protein ACM3KR_10055 [Deltaproteobacteria bacterium]
MANIPSSKIEEKAARTVSDAIDSCPLLKSDIKIGEKGITWDGDILVYSNKEQTKEQLIDALPVQVKGRIVRKFAGKKCSYPAEVSDINNYLIKKGVIFFVVEINESFTESRIYYTTLLPVDLKKILGDLKATQKKKNIHLKYVPNNKYNSFQYICKDALSNRKLQWSEKFFDIDEISQMYKIELRVTPEDGDIDRHLLENEIYIYGKRDEKSPLLPFRSRINFMQLVRGLKKRVSVNGKEYYSEYEAIRDKVKGQAFKFGKGVILEINKDGMMLNIKADGRIEERIKDAEFYIHTFAAKSVEIDGSKIELNFENIKENKKNVENIKGYLDFLNKAKDTLDIYGVNFEGNFDDLLQDKNHNLEELINYTNGRPIRNVNVTKSGIYNMLLGSICIGVFINIKKDGTLEIINLFGGSIKNNLIHRAGDGTETVVNPFILLKAEDIIKYSNFNKDVVYSSIKAMELNEHSINLIILLLLEIIKAYDKEPSRKEFLALAELLQSIIENYSSNAINTINRLQIFKRQRTLNRKEKSELIELRKTNAENQILCAISILLDNISDYELYYDMLMDEERTIFNNYPIYNLRPDLNDQYKTG